MPSKSGFLIFWVRHEGGQPLAEPAPVLHRFSAVTFNDPPRIYRRISPDHHGRQLGRQRTTLPGAPESGDDLAGREMHQGPELVPVRSIAGALEDAEGRRDHTRERDLSAVHENDREPPPAPRQGQRTPRPGAHLQIGISGF